MSRIHPLLHRRISAMQSSETIEPPGAPHFDWDLIGRYDTRGPRYTSYPTAVQFNDEFSAKDYRRQVRRSNAAAVPRPLSVYLHIPFCEHLCFYCACNKIATRNRARGTEYLHYLLGEIDLQAQLHDPGRRIEQLHFGGGTPTFLTTGELAMILARLRRWFHFADDASGDYSIEIDPRTVSAADMDALRAIGFNRVSLGVQDFDPAVQKAVHRLQSREQTLHILAASREAGVRSINVDLIYGLPKQSESSIRDTVGEVIDARPERVSLFNYAHLPERFIPQRRIRAQDLPGADRKLRMLKTAVELITAAGYVYIGMDHFALPGDSLARSQADGTLHRNFQGYTTHADCELVGFGVSSIGHVGRCFSQNAHDLKTYMKMIDEQRLPIVKGTMLDDDDELRAHIINALMCFGELDTVRVERQFNIEFFDYFRTELSKLRTFMADGLVYIDRNRVAVTNRGRMLVRNICAAFDRYLPDHEPQRFSKTI